ncbi:hypothetical protein PsYK624_054470 [Phanerochaete sordida]|uniref:Uncharacterized protein n=1 Tax=Phanerochaete sordida TaxID=48140 RepID=A0A9P3G6T6_9APHY|nr:hypothetical protein PsYK624_054470 [Phanerochaete sordida]
MQAYHGTLEAQRAYLPTPSAPESLFQCVIRHGLIYFTVILAVNVIRIASGLLPWAGVTNPFTQLLPMILACRFMANLRRVTDSRAGSVDGGVSSVQFAVPLSRLGNIGETLDHRDATDLEEDALEDANQMPAPSLDN